ESIEPSQYITGEKDPAMLYVEFRGQYSKVFDVAKDVQKSGLVNQTTTMAIDAQGIADFLKTVVKEAYQLEDDNIKSRFAENRDTLCYATNDNQTAVIGMLEEKADFALVIGGYNSSNTSHLVELCEETLPTYFINDEM